MTKKPWALKELCSLSYFESEWKVSRLTSKCMYLVVFFYSWTQLDIWVCFKLFSLYFCLWNVFCEQCYIICHKLVVKSLYDHKYLNLICIYIVLHTLCLHQLWKMYVQKTSQTRILTNRLEISVFVIYCYDWKPTSSNKEC